MILYALFFKDDWCGGEWTLKGIFDSYELATENGEGRGEEMLIEEYKLNEYNF